MENLDYKSPALINEAAAFLESRGVKEPKIGIILGSGLGSYAEKVENPLVIKYKDIPGFAATKVDSHAGELVFGKLNGKSVIILSGRFHFYEGHSMSRVVLPTRVLIKLGIKRLIITNAAGAINESYKAGDLMVIKDHINFFGTNPLIGENLESFGPRFPDMTNIYNEDLRKELINKAADNGLILREGVYLGLTGPSFETPAEIKAFRVLGADAVGMSSVPEAIVANHAGLEIIGISCQSNMAAGILKKEITSDEVGETAYKARHNFYKAMDIAVSL